MTCYNCVFVIINNNNNNNNVNRVGTGTLVPTFCFLETAVTSEPCQHDAYHTALLSFHWKVLISTEEILWSDWRSQFPCLVESSVEHYLHSLKSLNMEVLFFSTSNLMRRDVKKYQNKLSNTVPNIFRSHWHSPFSKPQILNALLPTHFPLHISKFKIHPCWTPQFVAPFGFCWVWCDRLLWTQSLIHQCPASLYHSTTLKNVHWKQKPQAATHATSLYCI